MSHTKGPWFLVLGESPRVETADRTSIATFCCWDERAGDIAESEANARLASAAPDLLAACKELAEVFDGPPGCSPGCSPKMERLYAAIAKAELR